MVCGIRWTPRACLAICRQWYACYNCPHTKYALISIRVIKVVFPEATKFYTDWQHVLESRGVQIRLNTEVDAILSRSKKEGVQILTRPRRQQPDLHNPVGEDHDLPQTEEHYDEIVLCCLADTANRLLGKTSRWIDRQVLGSAKWSDDITVTHTDSEYMRKHFTVDFDRDQAVRTLKGRDESDRYTKGEKEFRP